MKIFKIKLQIFLTGFIIFQVFAYINKQKASHENTYEMQGQSYAMSTPAYADEYGGLPVNIPYSPYSGSATSNQAQADAMAQAEAQRMLQTGNIEDFQAEVERNPVLSQMMGL